MTKDEVDVPKGTAAIGAYLHQLAHTINDDPNNAEAFMLTARTKSPKRPWYEKGNPEPQGFEYDGDVVIDIQIVLPRRVGERIIR